MAKSTPTVTPNFEESLAKLEVIVERMESGELPLEEIICSYESGMELLSVCDRLLGEAENKIRLLTQPEGETDWTPPSLVDGEPGSAVR